MLYFKHTCKEGVEKKEEVKRNEGRREKWIKEWREKGKK